jgi:hypothetical protein
MAYGHAERNLALIHQLEAETMNLLGSLEQPDSEQPAWLQEIIRQTSRRSPALAGDRKSVSFFLISSSCDGGA